MRIACILAAGLGSRLKSLTDNATKCMVEVGGRPLVDHMLETLDKFDYDKYLFVTGHRRDELRSFILERCDPDKVIFIDNPGFAKTNNIFSLSLASDRLAEYDEIDLFESDIWVRPELLQSYLAAPLEGGNVLVSPYEYWMDGTCITLDNKNCVGSFVQKSDLSRFEKHKLFKTVNIYRLTGDFFRRMFRPFMDAYIRATGNNAYYEDVLRVLMPLAAGVLNGYVIKTDSWMEIDDAEDLRRCNILVDNLAASQHAKLVSQFGGFWKNSTIIDLTLLENPYFPTPEFIAEFSSQSLTALKNYPSTQAIIASIAGKSCDFEPHQIVVGNGVSELMSVLFSRIDGKVAVCRPTFLEYYRLLGDRVCNVEREFPKDGYRDALFRSARMDIECHLVVVNPNNPTGESLTRADVLKLADLQAKKGKLLILDESFCDFADDLSCAERRWITERSNLVILRSYGKTHGVGGLRLGVLVSSNVNLIQELRSALPIWNISSFAEIFLDLLPKYRKQYILSLELIKEDRVFLTEKLRQIGLTVYHSHANFILVKIPEEISPDICEIFLARGFLVKLLERDGLDGRFLRIALKGSDISSKVVDIFNECLSPKKARRVTELKSYCDLNFQESIGEGRSEWQPITDGIKYGRIEQSKCHVASM